MRFVTFRDTGGTRAGVLPWNGSGADGRVADLGHESLRRRIPGLEPQLQAIIEAGIGSVVEAVFRDGVPDDAWLPIREVQLLAPLPRPRRIIAVAHNYRDALAERGMELPTAPVVFAKDPLTVIGPEEPIVLPAGIGGVTYEAELAAVIGTPARKVAPDRALAHVAGYFIFNDVSASEIIRADGHFDRGKNFPTFGPSGPYFVTADEIADPQNLAVHLAVGDRVMQDSSTSRMLFGVADLISLLSADVGLEPGDVIATGTPAGVGSVRMPPMWLRPGDVLRTTVEGLGTLVNPVQESPAQESPTQEAVVSHVR